MKLLSVRHIDGPNIYIYKPVMVSRLDLEDLTERESFEYPGFADRLLRLFPGLREHHCAKGEPGGFVERLYGGTYFGHVVEHVAIEMAHCAGIDVHFGRTVYACGQGVYDVVMECKAFRCQTFLLESAMNLVQSLLAGATPDIHSIFAEAGRILARTQLGPSTQAIVNAALARNIPVRRMSEGSLVMLGHGKHRKLVEATITEQTSAVGVDIAGDKEMTKRVLRMAGIPVPQGGLAGSLEEALGLFHEMGAPVVIKPFNGNQGRGVSLGLQTEEDVREGYQIATRFAAQVIVERFVQGRNIRFLVVDGEFVAASERVPASVRGDGALSIQELIDAANQNPLRGDGHEKPLTKIIVDPVVEHTLRRQGKRLSDIPAAGETVVLRENANLSTGGEAMDVTDDIHESYRQLAVRTARLIGLDVCGIDMVVASPEEPHSPGAASVIEVNAAPGIRMHVHPSYGKARNVGSRIVDSLFPHGSNGRIPIISITGTNGKTTTTRLIGHVLREGGRHVGMTTTGGVWIDDQRIVSGDTTGPDSARMVLSDPAVDTAVLETARGGIVRGGLAYDKANVAVLTNITMDHFGQDGVESLEDLVKIKTLVGECVTDDGTVVLNADDENLVAASRRFQARIVYFSRSASSPVMKRHLAMGGVGYYVSRGWLVEARGSLTWDVAPVQDIPLTMGGTAQFQVENCLAAVAALRAVGCTRQQVAAGLHSFAPAQHNPGRCMMYRLQNGAHVVLDYGHNPDGIGKIGDWLGQMLHRRLIGVVGVPGDRIDHVIRQSANRAAQIFDGFVVKEDEDKRGRRDGEIASMMAEEIQSIDPAKPCTVILDESEALRFAVQGAEEGDIIVLFYEKLAPAQHVLEQIGGVPVNTLEWNPAERFAVPF